MTETTIYWPPDIAGRLGVRLATGLVQPILIASGENLLLRESFIAKVVGRRPEMPARLEVFDRRTFGNALVALQPFYLVPGDNGEDGPGPDYLVEVDTPGGRVVVGHGEGPILPPAADEPVEVFRIPGLFRALDLGPGEVVLYVDRGEAFVQAGGRRLPVKLAEAPTWARMSAALAAEAGTISFFKGGAVTDAGGRLVGVWAGDRHVLPV